MGKFENNQTDYKNNLFLFEYVSVVGLELIRSLKNFSFNKYNNELRAIPESSDFDSIKNLPSKFLNLEKKDNEFFNKLIMNSEKTYQDFKIKQAIDMKKLLYPCLEELKYNKNYNISGIANSNDNYMQNKGPIENNPYYQKPNFNSENFLKPSKSNAMLRESSSVKELKEKEINLNNLNSNNNSYKDFNSISNKGSTVLFVDKIIDLKSMKAEIESLLYTNKNTLYFIDEFMHEERSNLELLSQDLENDKVSKFKS